MSKDYVKKRQNRSRSNASRQFLMVLAAYLCGYLTATLFDFTSLKTWVSKHILKTSNLANQAQLVVHKTELPKPKFEFYTLLSKDNPEPLRHQETLHLASTESSPIIKPESPSKIINTSSLSQQVIQTVKVTEAVALKPAPSLAPTSGFLIQVASFNRRQDAEHLKASLLLKGYKTKVTEVSQNSVSWYRVIIGPFDSRQQAEKAQTSIAQTERMKGMIRKNG